MIQFLAANWEFFVGGLALFILGARYGARVQLKALMRSAEAFQAEARRKAIANEVGPTAGQVVPIGNQAGASSLPPSNGGAA